MAYGLRIKNPSTGAVILEYTDRITRVVGVFNTGIQNGSFNVPVSGQVWFQPLDPGTYGGDRSPANITISGNTISWSFFQATTSFRTAMDIIYGVY